MEVKSPYSSETLLFHSDRDFFYSSSLTGFLHSFIFNAYGKVYLCLLTVGFLSFGTPDPTPQVLLNSFY